MTSRLSQLIVQRHLTVRLQLDSLCALAISLGTVTFTALTNESTGSKSM